MIIATGNTVHLLVTKNGGKEHKRSVHVTRKGAEQTGHRLKSKYGYEFVVTGLFILE